jgi:hypothetical protein
MASGCGGAATSRRLSSQALMAVSYVAEGLQGQALAQRHVERAGRQGGQEQLVLGRAGEHGHGRMVLGSGAHHRRAADVDRFHRGFPAHGRVGHRFAERIEVHHHHIDRGDALGLKVGLVGGVIAAGQDAAMDAGVKGLDPAAKDFRGAGVLRHPRDRQARRRQHRGSAAAGEQAEAMAVVEGVGQRHHALLVRHTQKRRGCHVDRDAIATTYAATPRFFPPPPLQCLPITVSMDRTRRSNAWCCCTAGAPTRMI